MSAPDEAITAAATRVYSVPPEEFMATRTELVKAAKTDGDKALAAEIGRLRKPSVAAWAVNLLAHQGHSTLAALSDLGGRMRSATSRMDVAELTSLRPERDRLLGDVVAAAAAAVSDGGRTLSAAGQDEVRDTAIAALADPDAQSAVESGTLVRTLSYSGFGEVDVADAVAVTSTGRVLGVIRGGGGRDPEDYARDTASGSASRDGSTEDAAPTDDADARRATAQAALDAAEASVTGANAALAAAEELADAARERREAAQRQLDKADAAVTAATERVTEAKRARRAAEQARHAAEDALDAIDA